MKTCAMCLYNLWEKGCTPNGCTYSLSTRIYVALYSTNGPLLLLHIPSPYNIFTALLSYSSKMNSVNMDELSSPPWQFSRGMDLIKPDKKSLNACV